MTTINLTGQTYIYSHIIDAKYTCTCGRPMGSQLRWLPTLGYVGSCVCVCGFAQWRPIKQPRGQNQASWEAVNEWANCLKEVG